MLGPSRIFPTRPDRERDAQVIRVQERRPARQKQPSLGRMARRADWLADMWSEFPQVAERHRSYARIFRAASARPWNCPAGTPAAETARIRMRRMAWRAYRRAILPTPDRGHTGMFLAAQQQKVDSYWARELWDALGGDAARLSTLRARDWELQQICNVFPSHTPAPGVFHLLRLAWKWLRGLLPF